MFARVKFPRWLGLTPSATSPCRRSRNTNIPTPPHPEPQGKSTVSPRSATQHGRVCSRRPQHLELSVGCSLGNTLCMKNHEDITKYARYVYLHVHYIYIYSIIYIQIYNYIIYPPTPAAQGGARKGKGVCDTAGVANPPTPADARGSAPGNKTFSADHLEACNSSSNSSSSRQQQAAVGSSRQQQAVTKPCSLYL